MQIIIKRNINWRNVMTKQRIMKIIFVAIILLMISLYIVYVIGLFLRVGIDSDYSNLVLEATDILSGNVFLSGWNLTGISFVTTDLIFFIIGVGVAGTTVNAFYIAVILMFLTLIIGVILLCSYKEQKINFIDFFIMLTVAGIPNVYGAGILRAHTVAAAYVLIGYYCIQKIIENQNRMYLWYTIFVIVMSFGVAGDSITIIIGIVPLVFVSTAKLFKNRCETRKKEYIIVFLNIVAYILGKVIDTVFVSIGNINKNEFFEKKNFADLEGIRTNIFVLIESLLDMNKAGFPGEKLATFSTIVYFVRTLILIFAIYIIFYWFHKFITFKDYDRISVLLSLSVIFMSLAVIFTDIVVNKMSMRYIAFFPAYSTVLIIRFLKVRGVYFKKCFNKLLSYRTLITAISMFIMVLSFETVNYKIPVRPQDELAQMLLSKKLEYGYGKFWNASHVTVSSENKVKVRAVIYDGMEHIAQYSWFCKNDWYEPIYSNFVVIDKGESAYDVFGITEESVKKCIGKPQQKLETDYYIVYVYNRDISNEIIQISGT